MKASLQLECIGDDIGAMSRAGYQHALTRALGMPARRHPDSGMPVLAHLLTIPERQWCAVILGPDPHYGYERQFLRGHKDYTRANSVGSRGVYACYELESGYLYEVQAPQSWKRNDRYFCTVNASGEIERLSKDEVDAWIEAGHRPPLTKYPWE